MTIVGNRKPHVSNGYQPIELFCHYFLYFQVVKSYPGHRHIHNADREQTSTLVKFGWGLSTRERFLHEHQSHTLSFPVHVYNKNNHLNNTFAIYRLQSQARRFRKAVESPKACFVAVVDPGETIKIIIASLII